MDKQAFLNKLEQSPNPVVVDVWAPWCLPCRTISPAIDRLADEYAGKVGVWKINSDEEPGLVRQLGIVGIPTLLVYRGQTEILRQTGSQPPARLRALFEAGLTGAAAIRKGIAPLDRILRITSAFAIVLLAGVNQYQPVLLLAAAALFFSAIYDRCPLWNAIAPRVANLFKRN